MQKKIVIKKRKK